MAESTDHRRSSEAELLAALSRHEPLALAEAYHRTVGAAHAVARRLLPGGDDVEALLRDVYAELWEHPPAGGPLEAWVRARAFRAGGEALRTRRSAPASPSTSSLLPELPAPDVRYLDAAERALADLPEDERHALLRAHDQGLAASSQQAPGASAALERALAALAGPDTSGTAAQVVEDCDDLALGDWSLGLLPPDQAAAVDRALETRPGCAERSRLLRRGRRRLEGLPATPDTGHRILVSVLTASLEAAQAAAPPPPPTPPPTAPPGPPPTPPPGSLAADAATAAAALTAAVVQPEPPPPPGAPPVGDATITVEAEDLPVIRPVPGSDLDTDELAATSALDETPAPPVEAAATGELRLSDLLAEDEPEEVPDDDLFAPRPAAAAAAGAAATASTRSYAEELAAIGRPDDEDEDARAPQPWSGATATPVFDDGTQVYVEGEDDEDAVHALAAVRPNRLVVALAWIIPILAGGALGLFFALLVINQN